MNTGTAIEAPVELRVENIGGIDETSIDLSPGVTALVGRNATNRTSLLRALMAVCGSDRVSLKGDAEEGSVELRTDDTTYTRTLLRRNGSIATDGDPYLDDPAVADLFAFLLESNEARRAVERGEDLRDVIMRPIDTGAIQAEIDRLEAERRRLDERLDELDALEGTLPDLRRRRERVDERIAEERADLDAARADLEAADESLAESREERTEREEKFEELRAARSEHRRAQSELEIEHESASDLREELADLEAELETLPETSAGELAELETELDRLRERKRTVESTMNQLQRIIQFNESMLDGSNQELFDALGDGSSDTGSESIADRLLADDTVVCWTCGSEVDADAIESTLDRLRGLRKEKLNSVNAIEDRLDELRDDQRRLERQQRRRERIEHTVGDLRDELDHTETTIEELDARCEELDDEIERLEAAIAALTDDSRSELLELQKTVDQLQFDVERLERECADVTEEIDTIEDRLEKRATLRAQREDVREAIVEQRTRIERIEQEAIERFNEQMDDLLELLDYANVERIWLEPREREVDDGRHSATERVFELHVVRSTASGTTYEDTISHLSESEREVTGLVFALSGYLTHEVYETVPFLLLDSLEAIDSERIATLVDYVGGYAEYVVAALLPEDAAALDDDYRRVAEI